MNLGDPTDVGLAQVPARLLGSLARISGGVTIRQLARISGVSLARTHHWVNYWSDRGVVTQIRAGRALLCSLNREHVMTDSLVTLASARQVIADRIAGEIAQWLLAPLSVTAFGSFARGDGSVTSDIDLLVIFEATDLDTWAEQLARSAEILRNNVGNPIQFLDYSRETWRSMRSDEDPLVKEIHRDGIHIFGEYLTLVDVPLDTA